MPCNILIVEDEEAIRETFKLALEVRGYAVVATTNGKEGLEALARIPRPCMILLDLMMPVMDGWSFLDELKKGGAWASIPVVVATAYPDKAKAIKADAVIKKPVALETLYTEARKYCGDANAEPT